MSRFRRIYSEENVSLLSNDEYEAQSYPQTLNIITPTDSPHLDMFRSTTKTKRAARRYARYAPPEEWRGRVASYCTCESYDIDGIYTHFGRIPGISPAIHGEVIHVQEGEFANVFIFPYGCVIMWGMTITSEKEFLSAVKKFRVKPLETIEYDDLEFRYMEDATTTKIVNDEILLEDPDVMKKLAISHGLAQSIKLSIFENNIDNFIEETQNLPEELQAKGKISLSTVEISKLMGRLFIQRNLLNLHSDILDVPAFLWDHDELEKYYRVSSTYMDKNQRVEVLNKRLVIVEELLNMLRSELHSKNDSKLEWIIIALIVVEVFLEILDMVLYKLHIV